MRVPKKGFESTNEKKRKLYIVFCYRHFIFTVQQVFYKILQREMVVISFMPYFNDIQTKFN